jgi:ElaB/YqjD/DUF883 family membrane-anchored ribosome-binding protein
MNQKFKTTISLNIEENVNGTYEVYISEKGFSGNFLSKVTSKEIGENVTKRIEALRDSYFTKLNVNGQTIILTQDVIQELHHQEYIKKGKLMVKSLDSTGIFDKMTDDEFAMVADEFEYMLNTTSDNISEMMEAAVQKITQRVEGRCNQVKEKNAKELLVNGKTVVLSNEVINELHRQERIEEGKYMMKIFSSTDTFGKMTDDDFEEIVLSFEEMLNTDTNELMAEAVQNISEQVEKRYRKQQEKINVQKELLKQCRTDNP